MAGLLVTVDNTTVSLKTIAASDVVSPYTLCAMRAAFACIVAIVLHVEFTNPPIVMKALTWPGSQIDPTATIKIQGRMKLYFFTEICWATQGLYFGGAAAASLMVLLGSSLSAAADGAIALLLLWLFEISFATALLTTVCVTFVLIPLSAKNWAEGKSVTGLHPRLNFFKRSVLIY